MFFLIFILSFINTHAQQKINSANEYQLKLAYIYNFTKFIEWPESKLKESDTFNICTVNFNPFSNEINKTFANKFIQNKNTVIMNIDDTQIDNLKQCNLIFYNKKVPNYSSLLRTINSNVLTIGEDPIFQKAGGIINFVITDTNLLRFEINNDLANKANLKISSKLLSIATIYKNNLEQ